MGKDVQRSWGEKGLFVGLAYETSVACHWSPSWWQLQAHQSWARACSKLIESARKGSLCPPRTFLINSSWPAPYIWLQTAPRGLRSVGHNLISQGSQAFTFAADGDGSGLQRLMPWTRGSHSSSKDSSYLEEEVPGAHHTVLGSG